MAGNYQELEKDLLPCIAHVIIAKSYKHFVVVYKVDLKRKKILLADPARGIINMTFKDFENITTGNFILLTPRQALPNVLVKNNFAKVLMPFLIKNKKNIIMICVFSFIFTILNILSAYNFKFVLDGAIVNLSKNNLYVISLVMLFVVFI